MPLEAPDNNGFEKDTSEYQGKDGLVSRWLKEIELVKNSKAQQDFERIGKKIVETYRNEGQDLKKPWARTVFNVLWSTVQVLKPTYYWRQPKVIVERFHKDADPIGRLASQCAERATEYMLRVQQDRFNFAVKSAVEDRLLPGRGQVWLRYDAEFEESVNEQGEPILDEEGQPASLLKPNSEKVWVDFVTWLDYLESLSRNPYEVRWRARRTYMTRSQLVKRFGALGKAVALNHNTGSKDDRYTQEEQEFLAQAEVWEIDDLEGKQTLWISEGLKTEPLDVKPDRYRLCDFFSSPIPLLATTTTDTTHPTPDFKIWESLADELDYTLKRLGSMVSCVRMVGATASQFHVDVKNMLKLSDGELWPVDNWSNWTEKGGLRGVMDWLPFEQAVSAIAALSQHSEYLLSKIYEITGIPDIIRGSSDPNEPLGTTKQKLRWVSIKVEEKQQDVQRFCREIINKVAEIIFEPGLFSDDTIALMCGVAQMPPEDQAMFPQALQLLRDDRLRTFRVDIETDSTIAVDEKEDQAARMEYITAVNQLVSNVQNITQFRPELMHPIIESALFAVRAFRTGRPLEGAWERALQQIEDADEAARQNPAPTPPDYEGQKLELMAQDQQLRMQEAAFRRDLETQKLQLDAQNKQTEFGFEAQKIQIEGMKVQSKAQVDATAQQLEAFSQQFKQFVEAQRLELEKYQAVLDEKEKFLEERRLNDQKIIEAQKLAVKQNGNISINMRPRRKRVYFGTDDTGKRFAEVVPMMTEEGDE